MGPGVARRVGRVGFDCRGQLPVLDDLELPDTPSGPQEDRFLLGRKLLLSGGNDAHSADCCAEADFAAQAKRTLIETPPSIRLIIST